MYKRQLTGRLPDAGHCPHGISLSLHNSPEGGQEPILILPGVLELHVVWYASVISVINGVSKGGWELDDISTCRWGYQSSAGTVTPMMSWACVQIQLLGSKACSLTPAPGPLTFGC